MLHSTITQLIEALSVATARSPNTVARKVAGSGDFYSRLIGGHDLTTRRAEKVLQRISDHWPADLPWPTDTPRPTPSPSVTEPHRYRNGTPADLVTSPPADPVEAEIAAIEAASVLDADGHIANPAALCEALQVPRYVYDQVIRGYADGKPRQGRMPRRGRFGKSPTERMLRVLAASGDVRFSNHPLAYAAVAV